MAFHLRFRHLDRLSIWKGGVVSVTPRVKTVRPLKVYGRGELLASYLRSRFVVVVRHRSEI